MGFGRFSTVWQFGPKHLNVGFHFRKVLEICSQVFLESTRSPYSGYWRPKTFYRSRIDELIHSLGEARIFRSICIQPLCTNQHLRTRSLQDVVRLSFRHVSVYPQAILLYKRPQYFPTTTRSYRFDKSGKHA